MDGCKTLNIDFHFWQKLINENGLLCKFRKWESKLNT